MQRVAKSLELRYREGEEWKRLPDWAKFFISLGSSLSCAASADRRIVAAASVPTPSFAAAFIALGRILSEPISEPESSALDAHFQKLALLSRGTRLIYFNGEALYHGPFIGIVRCAGEEFIRMTIPGGTCMVPKRKCLLLEVQPESDDRGPLLSSTGRLRNPKPFVSQFFTLIEHYRILCSTARCVVMVGEKNRLRIELTQTRFAIQDGIQLHEGRLQDLIRVAKFSAGTIGSRADVYAKSGGRVPRRTGSRSNSPLIILDGAGSGLNWAHEYPEHDVIAIFSRTEADYISAIAWANGRYMQRLDDCPLPGLLAPPPGIDLMTFSEPRS